jgi:ribosome-associated protein
MAADYPSGLMKLDQFLKFQGLAATGGEAKLLIQRGLVQVNGQIESRRGRQLRAGDEIELAGVQLIFNGESTN